MNTKRDWEDLAKKDPLWAILSDPLKRNGKWDENEFFKVGRHEIDSIIAGLVSDGILASRRRVLDFGCGVGRVAGHFHRYFENYVGVDISEEMIRKAREYNKSYGNADFYCINETKPLSRFKDDHFDFIYSYIVLQHIPKRSQIEGSIKEFIRCLSINGVAYFQLPSAIPLLNRLQLKQRAYKLLRNLGVPSDILYNNLKLYPISMNYIRVKEMEELFLQNNVKLIRVENPGGVNTRYLIQKQ